MEISIFGATGLVGESLLNKILMDTSFTKVNVFIRGELKITNDKLSKIHCDFETLQAGEIKIPGEIVFNCLGTTIKKAGSQEVQDRIDADYPILIAQKSKETGARRMVSVSSIGASEKGNFYLRTKAKMEMGIRFYFKDEAYFIRPSFLVGKRKEFRLGEKLGIALFYLVNLLLWGKWKKYRSVSVDKVADKLILLAKMGSKDSIHYM